MEGREEGGGREGRREGGREGGRACSGSPFLAPPKICPSSTTSMLVTVCHRLHEENVE